MDGKRNAEEYHTGSLVRARSFSLPRVSDTAAQHHNITAHSYLTVHISSLHGDSQEHIQGAEFSSGSEGHDSSRISRWCRRGQNEGGGQGRERVKDRRRKT
ncbi:hypothetical protein GOODEAATRI_020841 [Goodea atripinnis]|uniref:Uncharacterized protein n=1 Tax=Goodea atripinnis TaxID=208336 RepID=A0ABV0MTS6_9TELE